MMFKYCKFGERLQKAGDSEDHGWVSIDHLESSGGRLVQHTLGHEAVVLVEVVGSHASSEGVDIALAELLEDSLSWGAFIFSWETVARSRVSERRV